ncbi:MAG: hypothetical protein NZ840_13150 [Anaerolineales bacterium]|nr:hypothetical protein [Anaerolineales bacterium]MDW8162981.1 hypothetical protein [Anaerolineales bacterium]
MSVGTGIVGGRVVGVLTVTAGVGDIPADGVNVGVALQAEPKTNITKMDTIFRKGLDIFSSKQPAALIGGLTVGFSGSGGTGKTPSPTTCSAGSRRIP